MHANTQPPVVPSGASPQLLDLAAEVLSVLADPTRLRLAALLIDKEVSVSDLAATLNRPVPGVSQHLARLRAARLVSTRKYGNRVLYRIDSNHVRQLVIDTIGHVEHLVMEVPHLRSALVHVSPVTAHTEGR